MEVMDQTIEELLSKDYSSQYYLYASTHSDISYWMLKVLERDVRIGFEGKVTETIDVDLLTMVDPLRFNRRIT